MTMMTTPAIAQPKKNTFNTISRAALLAGCVFTAMLMAKQYVFSGNSPVSTLKYVASVLFGKEAMAGGWLMIIWGLVILFLAAFFVSLSIFLSYAFLQKKLRNLLRLTIVYGLVIWLGLTLMTFLSDFFHPAPIMSFHSFINALMITIGLVMPLVLVAHRHNTPPYIADKNIPNYPSVN